MAELVLLVKGAVDLANALGTSGSGQMELPGGRTINWSFKGEIRGFQWKYKGISVDSKTGRSVKVYKQSKSGAVEHCIKDLIQQLQASGQY